VPVPAVRTPNILPSPAAARHAAASSWNAARASQSNSNQAADCAG
jgi:hypothetical protein